MSFLSRILSIVTLLAVSACGGGGGDAGDPPFGSGTDTGSTGSSVAVLDIQLSAATVPNTGAETVTAKVTALSSSRVAVSGAAVTLTADSGIVTVTGDSGSTTDSNGQVVATVAIGADHSNRTITLTASSNGVSQTTQLLVVNATSGNGPASIELIASGTAVQTSSDGLVIRAFVKDANNNALAAQTVTFSTDTGTLSGISSETDSTGVAAATLSAGANKANRTATVTVASGTVSSTITLPITGTKLTLSGPTSLILGNSASFDLVLTDSGSNPVSGEAVSVSSSLGNTVTAVGSNITNASGAVTFTYSGNNSGTDSLVFSAAGATATPLPALVVSGDDFSFSSPAASTTVAVSASQTVSVLLRSGGVPQVGKTIDFTATGGTLTASTATTNSSGIATTSLTSAAAGPITVQATVRGTLTTASLPLNIVATTPASLILQISPTALAPNLSGSSTNQAQVLARVTDATGNPVQGKVVNFVREADPSGGNLLQPSATTDSNGQAIVAYRAGAQSTADNGVVIRGSVAENTSVTGTASLTVNQSALFISLGTGNVITNLDPQTYQKDWVVYVTDSNGIAVNGVTVTLKAIPTYYRTGELKWSTTDLVWTYSGLIYSCRNEDNGGGNSANAGNGRLDPNEDDNGDGVLWPGNVIAVTPGSVQTTNGRATISLVYAESYVPWVQLQLVASAVVSGTESKTIAEFIVPGDAEDFNKQGTPPAGRTSPFGTAPINNTGFCTLVP